jgi:hypothetical protein
MSRTIQQQLALIQVLKPCDEPAPEKSWLRQMADRAGHPPGVRHAPEVVIEAMLGRWSDQYQTELQKLRGK